MGYHANSWNSEEESRIQWELHHDQGDQWCRSRWFSWIQTDPKPDESIYWTRNWRKIIRDLLLRWIPLPRHSLSRAIQMSSWHPKSRFAVWKQSSGNSSFRNRRYARIIMWKISKTFPAGRAGKSSTTWKGRDNLAHKSRFSKNLTYTLPRWDRLTIIIGPAGPCFADRRGFAF